MNHKDILIPLRISSQFIPSFRRFVSGLVEMLEMLEYSMYVETSWCVGVVLVFYRVGI